jgi:hypothetical protein
MVKSPLPLNYKVQGGWGKRGAWGDTEVMGEEGKGTARAGSGLW